MARQPQLSTQVRLPPELFKRVRRLAAQHGLEYGEMVQRMVTGRPGRTDPLSLLTEVQTYLKRYGPDLEEAIEAVGDDPEVVQTTAEWVGDLEESLRRAFKTLPEADTAAELPGQTDEAEDDE